MTDVTFSITLTAKEAEAVRHYWSLTDYTTASGRVRAKVVAALPAPLQVPKVGDRVSYGKLEGEILGVHDGTTAWVLLDKDPRPTHKFESFRVMDLTVIERGES